MSNNLSWTEGFTSDIWRSDDGRYVILRSILPERRPDRRHIYTVRKIESARAGAGPDFSGKDLGTFVAEADTLDDAKGAAERDAWIDAQGTTCHVPRDYPALALNRFGWPDPVPGALGALVLVHENERLLARVVGMTRQEGRFRPVVYAELDVTAVQNSPFPAPLTNCNGCRVAPGTDHTDTCDHARCPACGEQRAMCDEHDDARAALWHGVDQRAAVARQFGWWKDVVGLSRRYEDDTRVLFAEGLGQVTWNPVTQAYDVGTIDEAALDDAMQRG
ncbi:hypothetical protein [Actinophytocola sp.]|uniref:hypothetical protein n=1 Tax=Actinophytocola sp. TaxID=1872138 RepID=UPI002ED18A28